MIQITKKVKLTKIFSLKNIGHKKVKWNFLLAMNKLKHLLKWYMFYALFLFTLRLLLFFLDLLMLILREKNIAKENPSKNIWKKMHERYSERKSAKEYSKENLRKNIRTKIRERIFEKKSAKEYSKENPQINNRKKICKRLFERKSAKKIRKKIHEERDHAYFFTDFLSNILSWIFFRWFFCGFSWKQWKL